MPYPDNFTGFHGFQPRPQGEIKERPYEGLSIDLIDRIRGNLTAAEGLCAAIPTWNRVRMIAKIDAEIALRAAQATEKKSHS